MDQIRNSIRSAGSGALFGAWIFSLLWNAVAFPALFLAWDQMIAGGEPGVYLILLFPLVGIGMLLYALYLTWRRMTYGVPLFVAESLPVPLGGECAGRILLKTPLEAENGIAVKLSCLEVVTVRTGKSRSTREELLWMTEQNGIRVFSSGDTAGTSIPVRCTLPFDLPPSSTETGGRRILWRLEASADVPGVDFSATFELPVARTEKSSPELTESAVREARIRHGAGGYVPPADAGVVMRRSAGGGKEYVLIAGRNVKTGLGFGLVAVIWTGIVVALAMSDAPIIFPIVFGGFGLLIVYGVLQVSFGETTFVIEEKSLSIRQTLFGIMTGRRIPRSDIERITIREGAQSGSTRFYGIAVVRRGGAVVRAGGLLRSRQHAEWLAAEIERSCREA
jgi:hypothetical protein